MHLGRFECMFCLKKCVCDDKIVFCILGQGKNTTGVYISHIVLPNSATPCFVTPTDSAVEVCKITLSSFGIADRMLSRVGTCTYSSGHLIADQL